jgi:hypothetical protein
MQYQMSDVQLTFAHSPRVISRTKDVDIHQCKHEVALLGQSKGEKWKRSLLLITKPESCTQEKT